MLGHHIRCHVEMRPFAKIMREHTRSGAADADRRRDIRDRAQNNGIQVDLVMVAGLPSVSAREIAEIGRQKTYVYFASNTQWPRPDRQIQQRQQAGVFQRRARVPTMPPMHDRSNLARVP